MHPRPSILSLFDPLSNSADDKENNVGESSFFHPHSAKKPYVPTFRRRLIDIGDITVDEPDMHDLLAEQVDLEDEIIQNIPNDDNDTLTFRDMAKAATPKWSHQRPRSDSANATPLSSPTLPTPRTPLADIYVTDDATPVGRKLKSYKRAIASVAPKSPFVDNDELRSKQDSSPVEKSTSDTQDCPSPFMSPPRIEIHSDESEIQETPSKEPLASSVSTLDLPSPTGAPIADTPLPSAALGCSVSTLDLPPTTGSLITDIQMPDLDSSSSSRLTLEAPVNEARLRPTIPPSDSVNRLSVDLHASFQLHLSSSDTTFDLLNEQVSFFNSKDSMDSFLGNMDMDDSFDFGQVKQVKDPSPEGDAAPKAASTYKDDEAPLIPEDRIPDNPVASPTHILEPGHKAKDINVITHKESLTIDKSSTISATPPTRIKMRPRISVTVKKTDEVSQSVVSESRLRGDEKVTNTLATPSTSSGLQYPPRPVPALKIVKRSRIASQPNVPTNPSRRKSSIAVPPLPTSRTNLRSASPEMASTATIIGSKPADGIQPGRGMSRVAPAPAPLKPPTNGNGPRRVLISEGPKLTSVSNSRTVEQAKAGAALSGPRRIVAAPPPPAAAEKAPIVTAKPATQTTSGLKAPQKYSTVGPSSAIPKPLPRAAGSRLPAPSKARFGVPTALASGSSRGLPARRVT